MIGEFIEILSGYAFNSALFNDEGKGTPLVRIRDVGKDRIATYFDGDYSEDYLLKDGDFLIGMDGDFRLAEWKGGKALLNQRVCKITPNEEKINARYLFFLLPKELKKIEDTTSFATVKHLSVKKIKNIEIPLPPLTTQKKIASILDAADAYRQKTKALIAKFEELTQSLFLDMFGDPVRNPFQFPIVSLDHICIKITDGEHGTVKRLNEGKLYLMARNIRENFIDLSDVSYIGEEDHKRIYKRCKAEKGDILLVCVGATIGRLCITPEMEEFSLARSVALLKPKTDEVVSQYLYRSLATDYIQSEIKRSGNSSAQAGLYTGKIKALQIALPPLSLQNQFAERVQKIEEQKAQAQQSLEKAEELFNSLLQRAFKGEME